MLDRTSNAQNRASLVPGCGVVPAAATLEHFPEKHALAKAGVVTGFP